jgi:hypothetical protein
MFADASLADSLLFEVELIRDAFQANQAGHGNHSALGA